MNSIFLILGKLKTIATLNQNKNLKPNSNNYSSWEENQKCKYKRDHSL
jgi:hypothetical protein